MRQLTITMINGDTYNYEVGSYDRYTICNDFFTIYLEDSMQGMYNLACVVSVEFDNWEADYE